MDNIFHYIDKNLYSPPTVRAVFSLELVCGFVRLVSGYVDTDRRGRSFIQSIERD